jgi:putative ABC transport system permease protein
MNIFRLALASISHKKLHSFLSILLLSFSLALIMVLFTAKNSFENSFTRNIKGIDLVVGAKGSPLQIILSSVYHIDAPTGNIALGDFEKLAKNRFVKNAIPLAYGDNYKSKRIVGTDTSYPALYEIEIKEGRSFEKAFEVCIGETVALELHLKLGDRFHGSHGFNEEGESHGHQYFTVVGIYKSNGSVLDDLILCPLESIWLVHDHSEADHHEHKEPEREITAGLIQFSNPMATLSLPRQINSQTKMQAALPSIEVNRLFTLARSATELLEALAYLLLLISGISVFVSLLQGLKDEEPQLAFLRAVGISRYKVVLLVWTKSLFISLIGYLSALILAAFSLHLLSLKISGLPNDLVLNMLNQPLQLWLILGVLFLGTFVALLPAWHAYRINIPKTLADA